jgi:hypothetical protein
MSVDWAESVEDPKSIYIGAPILTRTYNLLSIYNPAVSQPTLEAKLILGGHGRRNNELKEGGMLNTVKGDLKKMESTRPIAPFGSLESVALGRSGKGRSQQRNSSS